MRTWGPLKQLLDFCEFQLATVIRVALREKVLPAAGPFEAFVAHSGP